MRSLQESKVATSFNAPDAWKGTLRRVMLGAGSYQQIMILRNQRDYIENVLEATCVSSVFCGREELLNR